VRIAAIDGAGVPVVSARGSRGLEPAGGRAAVAVRRVAVVAGLGATEPAVAADGGAGRGAARAGPALLHGARGGAAVPVDRVAVVAGFGTVHLAVAADR